MIFPEGGKGGRLNQSFLVIRQYVFPLLIVIKEIDITYVIN